MMNPFHTFRLIFPATALLLLAISPSLHAITDEEAAALRSEIAILKQENALLLKQNRQSSEKIDQLNTQVADLKASPEKISSNNSSATAAKEELKKSPWDVEIAAGGNYSDGNNNSYRLNLSSKAIRENEDNQIILSLAGEIGENEGQEDAERLAAQAKYRDFLQEIDKALYWYASADGLHDGINGVDYRLTVGPGLGYYFLKNDTFTLLLEGGPAYVHERLFGEDPTDSIRGRIGQEFDWQFTEYAKLFEKSEVLENLQDVNDWIASIEGGIETSVTKTISLRLSARYIYDNTPAEDKKPGDFTALGALVYKFQ